MTRQAAISICVLAALATSGCVLQGSRGEPGESCAGGLPDVKTVQSKLNLAQPICKEGECAQKTDKTSPKDWNCDCKPEADGADCVAFLVFSASRCPSGDDPCVVSYLDQKTWECMKASSVAAHCKDAGKAGGDAAGSGDGGG